MITFSRLQHSLWQLIMIAFIFLNFYLFRSSGLGLIMTLLFLWFNSKKLADIFFRQMHQGLRKTLGLFLILAYISLCYTLAYHLYQINDYVFWWLVVSIPLATEILSWQFKSPHYFLYSRAKLGWSGVRQVILPALVIIFDVAILIILLKSSRSDLIRSPWEILDYRFWLLLTLSNFCLVATTVIRNSQKNLWLIIGHFFLLSSLAVILYPLGYGYDSFIHLAALEVIEKTGSIEPRLFLYIGQYGLTFFLHDISQLSLAMTNKILLPFLFAIFWPSNIFYALKYGFNWTYKNSYLAVLWSLFVGFGFAIMTTPQGISFLLVLFYVFLIILYNKAYVSIYLLWLVSIMAMTIHPLGAIPLVLFSLFLTVGQIKKYPELKKISSALSLVLASVGLPLFFLIYELINKIPLQKILQINYWPLFSITRPQWWQSYNFPLDIIHNIGQNHSWLYILGVIIGLIIIFRNHKQIFFNKIFIFSSVLIINYLLAKIFLTFSLQISYQKDDYLERIIFLTAIAMLPIFLTTIFYASRPLIAAYDRLAKLWLIITTVLVMSVSIYFSYPVYDHHANDKIFNVTASDLRTVNSIEQMAAGEEYIVLANQMVGVAAINQYGFAHYYNGNFYYSMPLGVDNIYQNYLAMIEQSASRDEAIRAMDKAGVNKLYFVVNNYWHSAKQAIAQASQSADEIYLIDNGVNTIFVYQR